MLTCTFTSRLSRSNHLPHFQPLSHNFGFHAQPPSSAALDIRARPYAQHTAAVEPVHTCCHMFRRVGTSNSTICGDANSVMGTSTPTSARRHERTTMAWSRGKWKRVPQCERAGWQEGGHLGIRKHWEARYARMTTQSPLFPAWLSTHTQTQLLVSSTPWACTS